MARLDGVSQEKASWIIRFLYWLIRRKTGRLADAWRITAYVPRLLFARGTLEIILERSNFTDRRVRKLAELKTAMLIGCPSWIDAKSAGGRKLGITEEQLRELAEYQQSYAFTELEKVVLDLAVAMTRTPADISDELFEKVQKYFSNPQLTELVMAIAYANFRARFNRSFDIQAAGLSKGAYRPLPER